MRITERLGIVHPIIQAPMLGVSTPALAAAVSNAGGLGSIGLSASTPDQARALIEQTRALTTQPFNVNLFCHQPEQRKPACEQQWLEHLTPLFAEFAAAPPETLASSYFTFIDNTPMLEMLLQMRPAVVSFHFGLPSQAFIDRLKAVGIRLLGCATTLAEARRIETAGLDAIVAQGVEAGGHRGVFDPQNGDAGIGVFALVRTLAAQIRLPLIAAGGIMDGQGIRAVQTLGAQAAQLGTAFILCPESSANAAYREAFKTDRTERTAITAAISGRPARGMVNRLFTDIGNPSAPAMPDYPLPYSATKALLALASAQGNDDFAVQWAGQGAPLARAMPAGQLIETLMNEIL